MNLCIGTTKDPHEEVCHEDGRSCPACDLIAERDAALEKISDLEAAVRNLEETAIGGVHEPHEL